MKTSVATTTIVLLLVVSLIFWGGFWAGREATSSSIHAVLAGRCTPSQVYVREFMNCIPLSLVKTGT